MVERNIGQQMEDEDKIRKIFETGTQQEIELLLDFEKDPEVGDEQRKLITKVRRFLEARGSFRER